MEATHHQYSPIETDRLRDWIAKWIGAEFDIMIESHGVREHRVRGVPHIGRGLFGPPRAEIRITNFGA